MPASHERVPDRDQLRQGQSCRKFAPRLYGMRHTKSPNGHHAGKRRGDRVPAYSMAPRATRRKHGRHVQRLVVEAPREREAVHACCGRVAEVFGRPHLGGVGVAPVQMGDRCSERTNTTEGTREVVAAKPARRQPVCSRFGDGEGPVAQDGRKRLWAGHPPTASRRGAARLLASRTGGHLHPGHAWGGCRATRRRDDAKCWTSARSEALSVVSPDGGRQQAEAAQTKRTACWRRVRTSKISLPPIERAPGTP
jgi:hypothetical protein